jgi:transcription antitermination factor NusG
MGLDPEEEAELRAFLRHQSGLTSEERAGILARLRRPRAPVPDLPPGQKIRCVGGAFAGSEGVLVELLPEKGTARVELVVLGRPIVVELEFGELEPCG